MTIAQQSMKQEIEIMNRRIEDLEENDSGCLETSGPSDTTWMVKFLEQVAADKEKDLECPVRLETESNFCDQLLFFRFASRLQWFQFSVARRAT